MKIIVNTDKNWGIGRDNDLLFNIPEDMKFFRETTTGKVMVMGRRTLESFPGGKPLKNRVNIVLSRASSFSAEGIILCQGLPQLRAVLANYDADDVFVVGGGAIYRLLLPYCSEALVTRVQAEGPADTTFPNLDTQPGWQLVQQGEPHQHEGIFYTFCRYQNQNPRPLEQMG